MSPAALPPTGTAQADLLTLEFSEAPPAVARTVTPAGPREPAARPNPGAAGRELPGSDGEHLLQRVYGTAERARRFYDDQVLDRLNPNMIEFVGRMEMAFVATADAAGECDSSLRAGPPGFIQVLDERRIAYPEYRGNGVLASLGNISENPHVGILMLDFTRDAIGLHVNGRARVVEDADLPGDDARPAEPDRGRTPERWVLVEVDEAYIHCRKHIPRLQRADRARTWNGEEAPAKGGDYFAVKQGARTSAG